MAKRKTHEEFVNDIAQINPNIEILGKYIKSSLKILCRCKICNHEWETQANNLRYQGCPKCHQSKGERTVEQYLIDNNIKYIPQYAITIDSSINPSGFAYVDFYLPTLNTIIEYNGEQHYIAKEYFGGKIKFEHQLLRDNYIRNYCKENNIKLVEIMYNKSEDKIIEICKTRIL